MIKVTLYLLIGVAFFTESISAQCLQCSSAENAEKEECNNPNGNFLSKSCNTTSGCYVRVLPDGRVLRGCQSQLDRSTLDNCSDKEDELSCRLCNFPNCNGGLFPHHRIFCHFCDDRVSQTNCSAALVGSPGPCRTYKQDDKCIVRKDGDRVVRQCLSDYEDCTKEKSCKVCDSHGCNNQEYNSGVTMQESVIFITFAFLMTTLFQ